MSNRRSYPYYAVILLLVSLLFADQACVRGGDISQEDSPLISKTMSHDGLERSYQLLVPASYDRKQSTPLVMALHGGGGDGELMCTVRGGVQELAEDEGFIVVCPDGVEDHWNDGRELDKWRAHAEDIDDVGFLLALIDHLLRAYAIDPERIFVTGISNGGKMSLRLACEATDTFAAAAPVIASLPANLDCQPSRPISILQMNGTEDPLMPWEGGLVHFYRQELGEALTTPDMIAFWVTANDCDPVPQSEWLPDEDPQDETRIHRDTYTECSNGEQVVLYTVDGGGHTWPGGPQYLPEFIIGRASRDLHAGNVIWEFFETGTPQVERPSQ